MVNINDEFPSKYLKSSDLQGRVAKVQIAHVDRETISNDAKLVMYFRNREKGMVLNKTNARTIGEVYGDDTENWTGADIEVFSMKVDFQGRMVDGLRIRVPPPRQTGNGHAAPAPAAATASTYGANARDDSRMVNPAAPPAKQQTLAEELDDEIPF